MDLFLLGILKCENYSWSRLKHFLDSTLFYLLHPILLHRFANFSSSSLQDEDSQGQFLACLISKYSFLWMWFFSSLILTEGLKSNLSHIPQSKFTVKPGM